MSEQTSLIQIGLLDYPGAQLAAIHGLTDLFSAANRFIASERHFQVTHWKPNAAGSAMDTNSPLATPVELSCIIIPPSLGQAPPQDASDLVAGWILRNHKAGAVVCSVCAGAFVLASTGLLHGRTITTHWALDAPFRARFPDSDLQTDRLLINDNDIITAGGIMAWTDLGLNLIDRFAGPSTMLSVARLFLIDPGAREQSYYSIFSPVLNHGDKAILKVQHCLQLRFNEKLNIDILSKVAGLSERTFLRRFHKATSHKPTTYLQLLRVGKAREMLERTALSFNEIAWKVGYEDAAAFRKIFFRQIGTNPGEYRRRFSFANSVRQHA